MLHRFAAARAPRLAGSLFGPRPGGGCSGATVPTALVYAQKAAARRTIIHLLPGQGPTATARADGASPTAAGPRAQRQQQQQHPTRRTFRSTARRRAEDRRKGNGRDDEGDAGDEDLGFSARLKKMTKEYGWAALGVYLGLSVLDFPFCFALVRVAGTERIAAVEHWIVSFIPAPVTEAWAKVMVVVRGKEVEKTGDDKLSQGVEMGAWDVQEADERNKADASLATQLALAYAVHKSLIFIRVPLTAAVLPKVVKVLRSWGWNIGRKSR